MITQFIEEIPEGKSHTDFIRKPIALTIQEGIKPFYLFTNVISPHINFFQLLT